MAHHPAAQMDETSKMYEVAMSNGDEETEPNDETTKVALSKNGDEETEPNDETTKVALSKNGDEATEPNDETTKVALSENRDEETEPNDETTKVALSKNRDEETEPNDETLSEACARILLGFEALQSGSLNIKRDPKMIKILTEELNLLLSKTPVDTTYEESILICMNTLRTEVENMLSFETLTSLIQSSDIQLISRVLALLKQIKLLKQINIDKEEKDLVEVENSQNYMLLKVEDKFNEKLIQWRSTITVNKTIDIKWEGSWYHCKVINSHNDGRYKIHFNGYSKSHERWVDMDASVVPPFTHTVQPKPKLKKKPDPLVESSIVDLKVESTPEMVTNRYGRSVANMSVTATTTKKRKTNQTIEGMTTEEGVEVEECRPNDDEVSRPVVEDHNDWYCSVCMAFERDDGHEEDQLLSCDGPCLRSFHLECLGFDTVPDDDTWLCESCQENEHTCFLCHDSAPDAFPSTSSAERRTEEGLSGGCVVKCNHARCGKFYHPQCIIDAKKLNPLFIESNTKAAAMRVSSIQSYEQEVDQVDMKDTFQSFSCGHHICATCQDHSRKSYLYKCHICPRAFHLNCVPPCSEFHEYCLICPDCLALGHMLPPLTISSNSNLFNSISKKYKTESEKLQPEKIMLNLKRRQFSTLNSMIEPNVKNAYDSRHFRLDASILSEVESRPPLFTPIVMNQYGNIPIAKVESSGSCSCQNKINNPTQPDVSSSSSSSVLKVCGDGCENRLLRIECFGEESKEKKGRNCCVGLECGNRQIGLRKGNVKVSTFMQEGMGWGLKLEEPVTAGTLIREYVGEVLTDSMLEERMAYQAKYNPNNVNMYVMELDSGLYLDARSKGNVSRFINHCCDPNCELQKWIVNGVTRIGIFAVVDMSAQTALSYDYKFSTNEHSRFRCKCGAVKCRGSLSAQGFKEKDSKNNKKQRMMKSEYKELLKKAKLSEKREMEKKLEDHYLKIGRLDLTNRTLPGDTATEIKNGPPQRFYQTARDHRLFLVRNAKKGAQMFRRKQLFDTETKGGVQTMNNQVL